MERGNWKDESGNEDKERETNNGNPIKGSSYKGKYEQGSNGNMIYEKVNQKKGEPEKGISEKPNQKRTYLKGYFETGHESVSFAKIEI